MSTAFTKDASIAAAVVQLRARLGLGMFVVTDHRRSDPFGIGLSSPSAPGRLVYITTLGSDRGHFDVSLELPPAPGDDLPYTPAGIRTNLNIDELASLVREHLSEHLDA